MTIHQARYLKELLEDDIRDTDLDGAEMGQAQALLFRVTDLIDSWGWEDR